MAATTANIIKTVTSKEPSILFSGLLQPGFKAAPFSAKRRVILPRHQPLILQNLVMYLINAKSREMHQPIAFTWVDHGGLTQRLPTSTANFRILSAQRVGTTGVRKATKKRPITLNIKALEKEPIQKTG